jgi:glycine/D-amino acid oxidase-like deaminating enzyme
LSKTLVIGGGIVGLSVAGALIARGTPVVLIDDDSQHAAASWGCAGHIAVEQVEPLASLDMILSAPRRLFVRGGPLALPPRDLGAWIPFMLRLIRQSGRGSFDAGCAALTALMEQAMPAWERLTSRTGCSSLLRRDGHIILWENPTSAASGLKNWRQTLTGTARFRPLDYKELPDTVRALNPRGGIRFEGTGQITDLMQLAGAMRQNVLQTGNDIVNQTVAALRVTAEVASVELISGAILQATNIVLCAGARSAQLLGALGTKVPLIAERGYHIEASAPKWPQSCPPIVFEDRNLIVTRFKDRLRAASFVEFSRLHSPPDRRKWERLKSHARAIGLPFEGEITQWMGARPTLPDYLPAIGRSRKANNLYYAFGHQHLGLTLGPVTGELVAALLSGDRVPLDLRPYDIDRCNARMS